MQACKKEDDLGALLEKHQDKGLTPAHLYQAARRVDPAFKLGLEVLKPAFSRGDKRQRTEYSAAALQQPDSWRKSIVYMDEGSVQLQPKPRHFLGHRGEEQLRTDSRCKRDPRQIQSLHFLLAVCWATGLLQLLPLSHSAGYEAPRIYYVSNYCNNLPPSCQYDSPGHMSWCR